MYQPRQILAYGTLSIFIVFVLVYGVADSVLRMYPASGMSGLSEAVPEPANICMFYSPVYTLPWHLKENCSSPPRFQSL